MSDLSTAVPVRRGPLVVAGGLLAAVVAAAAVNSVIAFGTRAVSDRADDFDPLDPFPYLFLTTVGTLVGAAGWAVIRSRAKNPAALLQWLVPTVVVLSFVPDLTQFGRGGAVGVAALTLMHLALVVIAVPVYRKIMPLR